MNKVKIQINISRKVFEEIKARNIEPRPRWHFVLQEAGVWLIGIVTTVFGAIAFSTVLFVLATAPLKYQSITHDNVLKFWIDFLPLLWLLLFICFILATDYFLKKTKRGYKYSFVALTLLSMTLSLILGYAGFVMGIGEVIEKDLSKRIPFHTPIHMRARQVWSNLEHGLITGRLGESESVFITPQGKTFVLDTDDLPATQQKLLTSQEYVGLIGTSTKPNIFIVCAVIPFEKPEFEIGPEQFERNESLERTNVCKGVRPYMRLQANILK